MFNANSVDPDQMLPSAADLGLQCLLITLLGVSQLKLVNLLYAYHETLKAPYSSQIDIFYPRKV